MDDIDRWLHYWRDELWNRDVRYELVVAHPADYHVIKNRASYPNWLRFEWTENVPVGMPIVLERAANYYRSPAYMERM